MIRILQLALVLLALQTPPPPASVKILWDLVTLDIEGNPETVAGYRVYRSDGATGPWNEVATVAAPPASVIGLKEGVPYWIAVTAYDTAGNESEKSDPIMVLIPPAPSSTPAAPAGLSWRWR